MKSAEFRKELLKIMPGYSWTVHKTSNPERLTATGIQSSGFNRLSTLQVTRTDKGGGPWYGDCIFDKPGTPSQHIVQAS